jgi:hypothetical protein
VSAPAPAVKATANRQPNRVPVMLISGTPATNARELPANAAAVARPARSGATIEAAT